jgi:hypothetical protein
MQTVPLERKFCCGRKKKSYPDLQTW